MVASKNVLEPQEWGVISILRVLAIGPVSPNCHSANPAALWTPDTQPTILKYSNFKTNQYNPPL